jgi:hypothetical protein
MVFEEAGIWKFYLAFLDIINSQCHIVIVYDKRSKEEYTLELKKIPEDQRKDIYTFDEILKIFRNILLKYPKEKIEIVEVENLLKEEWQNFLIKNSISIFPCRFIRVFYRKKKSVLFLEGLEREQNFVNVYYEMILDISSLSRFIDIFLRILN